MRWEWNRRSKRYRNLETGRFVAKARLVKMRDEFIERSRASTVDLATRVADGSITVAAWERRMRAIVAAVHGANYLFGRGGRNAMERADWSRLGGLLAQQYRYLNEFAAEIASGSLSERQIRARSDLYVNSSTQSHARGQQRAYGVPSLPGYPGDGATSCKANCRCRWEITERTDRWIARWKLGQAEHCDDCLTRADLWAALEFRKD